MCNKESRLGVPRGDFQENCDHRLADSNCWILLSTDLLHCIYNNNEMNDRNTHTYSNKIHKDWHDVLESTKKNLYQGFQIREDLAHENFVI